MILGFLASIDQHSTLQQPRVANSAMSIFHSIISDWTRLPVAFP